MTAHFAIPATTFVLRQILQERVGLAYGSLTAPTVSVEPPPRPPAAAGNGQPQPEPAGLHLFLHHLAPNPALRNAFEPHVSSAGRRTGPSPLALDLQYMLAATGADLEREVLLGLGITALTRHGIVPRPKIAAILGAIAVPATPVRLLDTLTTEALDQQPEQITVSQAPVDVDLSTKIWSALQSPLRPAAYFLVTTVFLEVTETFTTGPEVQRAMVGVRPDVGAGTALDTLPTPGGSP
jgi:hypothetical protein